MSPSRGTDRAVHSQAAERLAAQDQRYTGGRRSLVQALIGSARPLSVPEILKSVEVDLPQSSAYRNLTVLMDAGVVARIDTGSDQARFELDEGLSGDHHHHLVCQSCETVIDVDAFPRLERSLDAAARLAEEDSGFEVTGHKIDLVGRCARCRGSSPRGSD